MTADARRSGHSRAKRRVESRAGRLAAALLITVAVVSGLGTATSSLAQEFPTGWTYLVANDPVAESYTPALAFQFSSLGETNTVERSDAGVYTVHLPGFGPGSGNVQVTAVSQGAESCKAAGWGYVGSTLQIHVRCFDLEGQPADSMFSLLYTAGGSAVGRGIPSAYIYADNPTADSYVPLGEFQFNSIGWENRIERLGVGEYLVRLPNLGGVDEGNVQVSAFGDGAESCRTVGWGADGPARLIGVLCHDTSGTPADSRFTLTYTASSSLAEVEGANAAYVWANQPSGASYTPAENYQFNSTGALNSVQRTGAGEYIVSLPGIVGGKSGGNAQVTAFGEGSEQCKVLHWFRLEAGVEVTVRCFNAAGQLVDAPFTLLYQKSG